VFAIPYSISPLGYQDSWRGSFRERRFTTTMEKYRVNIDSPYPQYFAIKQ
jgi:hypothetical protein